MSATKTAAPRTRKRPGSGAPSTKMSFDYRTAAKAAKIPSAALRSLESEAFREFPGDPMLMELHVLRAVKAYGERRHRE